MSEVIKPTPGPWRVVAHNNPTVQPGDDWTVQGPNGEAICFEGKGLPEDGDNSALIAEAGTVHHETGLTPRQLVEQRDALAEALLQTTDVYEAMRSKLAEMYPQDGWSAETMTIDQARAALALVKGAKP